MWYARGLFELFLAIVGVLVSYGCMNGIHDLELSVDLAAHWTA